MPFPTPHISYRGLRASSLALALGLVALIPGASRAMEPDALAKAKALIQRDAVAVPEYASRKKVHMVPNFRIGGRYRYGDRESYSHGGQGGTTLESLGLPPAQISYIELGKPHRNEAGEIDNAILLCPYYSGGSTNYLDFWAPGGSKVGFSGGVVVGPGALIDTDRYYVIMADALGLWGASKPSSSHPGKPYTTALGLEFPQYRLEDCVQLMVRLLEDELGVKELQLVTGVSLGAGLTYTWGVLQPQMVKRLMPIGGTTFQNKGMARWLFELMTSAIESDPVYRSTGGDYYHLPRLQRPIMGNLFGWSIIRQSGFVDSFRCTQSFEQYTAEAFDWEKSKAVVDSLGTEGWGRSTFGVALMDSNDLIYRNRAGALFDIEGELGRIQCPTLIVHIETDQWLYRHIADRAHARIEGSQLLTFPHKFGHYAVFLAPNHYKEEMARFLAE